LVPGHLVSAHSTTMLVFFSRVTTVPSIGHRIRDTFSSNGFGTGASAQTAQSVVFNVPFVITDFHGYIEAE
jgi:hypothetical protein